MITFSVDKENVYNEVAKISSYVGAKSKEDEHLYNRVAITDSDKDLLNRYWDDCCGKVAAELQIIIGDIIDASSDSFSFTLKDWLDVNSNERLRAKILRKDLHSCFINFILYKWFELTNKEKTEYYFAYYNDFMKNVKRILVFKYPPRRNDYAF